MDKALYNKFKNFKVKSESAGWDAFIASTKGTALGSKLNGFNPTANSKKSWTNYSKKKRRKSILIFLLVKAPMIALLVALGLWTSLKNTKQLPSNASSQTNIENLESSINKYDDSPQTEIATKEVSVPDNNPAEPFPSIIKDKKNWKKESGTTPTKRNRKHEGFYNATQGILGETNPEGSEDHLAKNASGFEAEKEEDLKHNLSMVIPKGIEINLDLDHSKLKKPKWYNGPSLWTIEVSAGPSISKINTKIDKGNDAVNKYFNEQQRKATQYGVGYSVGVSGMYQYFVNTKFKLGLELGQLAYRLNYNFKQDSVPLYDRVQNKLFYLPPDTFEKPVVANSINKLTFINIPIGIEKKFRLRNDWTAIGSLSINFMHVLKASGEQIDKVFISEVNPLDKNTFSKWNVSYGIGVGLEKRITDIYSIGTMVDYRKNATNFGKDVYLESNFHSIGFKLMARYKF